VKATHLSTGSVYGGYSQEAGRFTLRGLRPGRYDVVVSFVGYQRTTISDVNVIEGESSTLSIALSAIGADKAAVTVIGESALDRSRMGSSSTIDEALITSSPTINRSISDMARFNPYTTQTETAGSDGLQGVSILGVNSRFNNFQIDGAVSNDLFAIGSAGTAGSQANSNFISLDAIERLKVSVSPYDVRQNGFTGGLINAITRGGTNSYTGSFFLYGRNQDLVGLSPDALRQPFVDFTDFQFGGRVGGPIIQDKLLFHITSEVRLRSVPLEVAINDPNALNNFPIPRQTFDEVIRISREQYGYDPGSYDTYNVRNNTFNIIARIDWNLDDQNKFQFRYNFTNAIQDRNLVRNSQDFSLSSRVNAFTSLNNQAVAQWNAIIGAGAANEMRLSFTQTNDDRVLDSKPYPEVRIQVGSGQEIIFGPERNSQANALDQTLISLTDDFTMFEGQHTITIGTHNELSRFNNLFIPDFYAQYQFPSVEAYADSTANSYQVRYANVAVTGTNQPRALWWMLQAGLYVMDEWQVNDRLRFSGGLRLDVPIYLTQPYENPVFAERFPGRSTSEVPQASLLWAPRLGFNYDLSGDRTLQIRGGTGVFSGRVAGVWLSNQYSNTGVDLFNAQLGFFNSQTIITDPATGQPIKWSLSIPPPTPGDPGYPGAPINTSAVNITDKNFRLPQVWRSTLAMDYEVTKGLRITVEGMYGKFFNQVDYANLNLKRSQRRWVINGDTIVGVSPLDGRPLYAGTAPDSLVAREFTQVILMRSRDAGYQWSFSTQVDLDAANNLIPGLAASFSYTMLRSEDINSGSNSTASSLWQFTDVVDPNDVRSARSNFDVPHRFLTNLSYTWKWTDDISTTIGLFFSSQTGRTYSVSYIQDYNGDNASGGNDLPYIPRPEDYNTRVVIVPPQGTDLRTADQVWAQLMAFIDANPVLKEYQGSILPRNALREPWRNQLDLRLTQKLPAFSGHRLELTWDVQNLLNFLDADWGLVRYVNFQSYNLFGLGLVNNSPFDDQGRLRMTFSEPVTNGQPGMYVTDNFYSRWRMQLGIRYTF
jgi:outer membrane receptor protein involved in Fe transport